MADVTALDTTTTKSFPHEDSGVRFVSALQTVSSTDDIILTEGTTVGFSLSRYAHCFIGCQFFTSDASSATATPTAGTMTIHVQTQNTRGEDSGVWEAIPSNTITAATPVTRSWSGNTYAIRVSPASLDVATHWRIVVTGNRT